MISNPEVKAYRYDPYSKVGSCVSLDCMAMAFFKCHPLTYL